jgi:rubrerythrin
MQLIKKLSEMIDDELEGAECYAEKALKYKNEDSTLAKMFYTMANEEMDHFEKLHFAVVEKIEEWRKQNGEPPAGMMTLYDYLHEKHIKHASRIKIMLAMYKE